MEDDENSVEGLVKNEDVVEPKGLEDDEDVKLKGLVVEDDEDVEPKGLVVIEDDEVVKLKGLEDD